MIREVFVVVTAPGGWGQSHGIDMLTSRAFNKQPIGHSMDGWTVAAHCATSDDAKTFEQDALSRGLSTWVLVFADGVADA